MEKTFVPGEGIVAYKHYKVILPTNPPRRLNNVVLRKRKIKRIKNGVNYKEKKTKKPGKKEHIGRGVILYLPRKMPFSLYDFYAHIFPTLYNSDPVFSSNFRAKFMNSRKPSKTLKAEDHISDEHIYISDRNID